MQTYANNRTVIPIVSVLHKRTQAKAIFAYEFVLKFSDNGLRLVTCDYVVAMAFLYPNIGPSYHFYGVKS